MPCSWLVASVVTRQGSAGDSLAADRGEPLAYAGGLGLLLFQLRIRRVVFSSLQ